MCECVSRRSHPQRLQNPIEKAEILDLAVEYLQKWTDEKNSSSSGKSPLSVSVISISFSASICDLTLLLLLQIL